MEAKMKPTLVKNKSLKISASGIISLPVAARKSLKMSVGKGCKVTVALYDNTVQLKKTSNDGGVRVSPKGQLELIGDAKKLLESGTDSHYWIELCDKDARISLHPDK